MHTLWGLWVTMEDPSGAERMGDMDQSAVARVRWMMMHHYSVKMWQVYVNDPTNRHPCGKTGCPTGRCWTTCSTWWSRW